MLSWSFVKWMPPEGVDFKLRTAIGATLAAASGADNRDRPVAASAERSGHFAGRFLGQFFAQTVGKRDWFLDMGT
jgi:hypothetical protein